MSKESEKGLLRGRIERASLITQQANDALQEVYDTVNDMAPGIDLSAFESKAENAGNLEEAISCHVGYGEFKIESLLEEIQTAIEAWKESRGKQQ